MTSLVKDEPGAVPKRWPAWVGRNDVRLPTMQRLVSVTVVGKVSAVSVTGAFVTVDGWHIPTVEVRGVARPTLDDRERYARQMRRLRETNEV